MAKIGANNTTNKSTFIEPLVSVIIPTFNSAVFIRETIDTIHRQTFSQWEAIFIDDGSDDGTADILQEFCVRNGRCLFINKQHTGLPAKTRNLGATLAKGKYLAFLDHDDLWHPRKLEWQVQYLDKYPSISMVYSAHQVFSDCKELKKKHLVRSGAGRVKTVEISENLSRRNSIALPSVLIRKVAFDKYGQFDEDSRLKIGEDYYFWLNLIFREPVGFIAQPLTFCRSHGANISANREEMVNGLYHIVERLSKQVLPKHLVDHVLAQALKSHAVNIMDVDPKKALTYLNSSIQLDVRLKTLLLIIYTWIRSWGRSGNESL